MRLIFADQASAQKRVDEVHSALIASNPLYAESAALYASSAGKDGTARWDFPKQDLGKDGKPVGTDWHITVDDRPRKVLTKAETDTVPEWLAQAEQGILP